MSSNIKEQLEVDISRFFEQIENQNFNDQKETLRILFDKYLHLTRSDYMMDMHDLREIVGMAGNKMANENIVRFLPSGNQKVKISQDQIVKLLIIESTIGHLNKKDCLKKIAKFDYKDNKF